MEDILKSTFQRKKVSFSKLSEYGFRLNDKNEYQFSKILQGSEFILTAIVTQDGKISAEVFDPSFGEPYILHLTDAAGSFVVGVRSEYEKILKDIANTCFVPDVFKSEQAKLLTEYVRKTYSDELEFLWQKFPDNAVWRRKDNKKWYGAILTVPRCKLGLKSDEIVEIIDLRYPADEMEKLIDKKHYFPGWHMNKKSWFTIILDESVETEKIRKMIDESYRLADK